MYTYLLIQFFFLTNPSNISKALSILYMNKYCMLYLTYKKENYLFLKKKEKKRNCYGFINVNWQYSTKRKIYNFVLINYKFFFFFLEQGVINMTSTFNKNVQCYKILHPENETGFHNLQWIPLKRSCLFLVWLNQYQLLQIIIRYNIYSKSVQSALSYFVIKLLKF